MINPSVKIAVEMDNGSLAILSFFTEGSSPTLPEGAEWLSSGHWVRSPTEVNVNAELLKAFPGVNQLGIRRPKPNNWRMVAERSIPIDRSYRNAWKLEVDSIVHDMAKAKELHRDKLRNQRMTLLLPLDIEFSRAIATGDSQAAAAIELQRQALRDITDDPRIDAAQSIEDLKLVTLL